MSRLVNDPAEAPLLAGLHGMSFPDDPWTASSLAALLESPGVFALTADSGHGFVLIRVAADEAEVLTLAVCPAARRRGVASALLKSASEEAAKRGASTLFLEVGCKNSPAIALYKRFGFTEVGRRKAYYASRKGDAEDAIVLRAEIPLSRVCNSVQLG